jgi:hypothetical protein
MQNMVRNIPTRRLNWRILTLGFIPPHTSLHQRCTKEETLTVLLYLHTQHMEWIVPTILDPLRNTQFASERGQMSQTQKPGQQEEEERSTRRLPNLDRNNPITQRTAWKNCITNNESKNTTYDEDMTRNDLIQQHRASQGRQRHKSKWKEKTTTRSQQKQQETTGEKGVSLEEKGEKRRKNNGLENRKDKLVSLQLNKYSTILTRLKPITTLSTMFSKSSQQKSSSLIMTPRAKNKGGVDQAGDGNVSVGPDLLDQVELARTNVFLAMLPMEWQLVFMGLTEISGDRILVSNLTTNREDVEYMVNVYLANELNYPFEEDFGGEGPLGENASVYGHFGSTPKNLSLLMVTEPITLSGYGDGEDKFLRTAMEHQCLLQKMMVFPKSTKLFQATRQISTQLTWIAYDKQEHWMSIGWFHGFTNITCHCLYSYTVAIWTWVVATLRAKEVDPAIIALIDMNMAIVWQTISIPSNTSRGERRTNRTTMGELLVVHTTEAVRGATSERMKQKFVEMAPGIIEVIMFQFGQRCPTKTVTITFPSGLISTYSDRTITGDPAKLTSNKLAHALSKPAPGTERYKYHIQLTRAREDVSLSLVYCVLVQTGINPESILSIAYILVPKETVHGDKNISIKMKDWQLRQNVLIIIKDDYTARQIAENCETIEEALSEQGLDVLASGSLMVRLEFMGDQPPAAAVDNPIRPLTLPPLEELIDSQSLGSKHQKFRTNSYRHVWEGVYEKEAPLSMRNLDPHYHIGDDEDEGMGNEDGEEHVPTISGNKRGVEEIRVEEVEEADFTITISNMVERLYNESPERTIEFLNLLLEQVTTKAIAEQVIGVAEQDSECGSQVGNEDFRAYYAGGGNEGGVVTSMQGKELN